MTELAGRIHLIGQDADLCGRVVMADNAVVCIDTGQEAIRFARTTTEGLADVRGVLGATFNFLACGDIVRIRRDGQMRVLYQAGAQTNALLVTERCNNACLMCSQPPRDRSDPELLRDARRVVDLIQSPATHLVITGGEPTLAGPGLFDLMRAIRDLCPPPSLQVLTNGRLLRYPQWCDQLVAHAPVDMLVCIPVYAATAHRHDAIVQASGAFTDTIRGVLNLVARGVRVEIRIVVHRSTVVDLVETARFIARNLPMVAHVSIMALELTGYTRLHEDALWIDPVDQQQELSEAVRELRDRRIAVRLYGYQLCVLPVHLHEFAMSAISAWKRVYMPACEGCNLRAACGGLFASQLRRPSRGLHAVCH